MQQNCTSITLNRVVPANNPQYSPVMISKHTHTSKHGRPIAEIDPVALKQLLELRGLEGTGKFLGCSTCTVRRWVLELGFVQPGALVFTHETQLDGSASRIFHCCDIFAPFVSSCQVHFLMLCKKTQEKQLIIMKSLYKHHIVATAIHNHQPRTPESQ